jgi:hypothetical protein
VNVQVAKAAEHPAKTQPHSQPVGATAVLEPSGKELGLGEKAVALPPHGHRLIRVHRKQEATTAGLGAIHQQPGT